jgi:ATP-dependent helicase HrpA
MADARIEELRALLPQCLLPDWVRLGSRLVRLLRDRHHPDAHEAILRRLLDQARQSVALRERRGLNVPSIAYPSELPITARKDDLVAALRAHQVVVIAGETGSGKTTQIPKMCLEAGLGIEAKIGCTQPRRVAALSISRRVSEELNVPWGREVGCKIRFDDRSSPETYIKFMTDGILLAETQGDPLLSEYNALIIDEAHERSLNIDFLLGYLKGLLAKRADLKLVITSATIDTAAFSRAFNDAPIIEVSGRLYPVETVYAPFDAASEESGELTFIDAAVNAAERVLYESSDGDVLIFMPGERDIRETGDLIEGRLGRDAEVIPLFGRLSAGEQQRVFAPSARRKVIIATNIAETSLTIPGIRYVIDSGLARISRYNPRTLTRRLPVEPISQSSANQRKGRSGRVQNGVCIRLYSEEDFAERPAYSQPEIQRANLAEVILRMKAFHLGDIATFPFINPPTPAAIHSGYTLLQELGALDAARELTPLGHDLARLPIDPTLGRMLLQSQHEHATRELLIIAAGLSIQDPRERPLDQKDAANAAHRRFIDPRSDFLTLLNIWNAFHEQWEILRTQNQRRKFCKAHFLSYTRMREWQDLHAQLHDALEERGDVRLNESNAAYEAIHRSILTGLLGHVANRTERNIYKASANRQVMVFPGSALFDRNEKPGKPAARSPEPRSKAPATQQPAWIMAGEIVETSQLFARTIAGIDPMWIVELGAHLCKVTHQNPHWSATAGRVLVQERITLHGLEVHQRKVAYGNVNPKEATEIFIRAALVEEELFPAPASSLPAAGRSRDAKPTQHDLMAEAATAEQGKLPASLAFLEHNRRIRQKITTWQTRVRRHDLPDPDQALFEFYARHLEGVSSLHELNRLVGERNEPGFLQATEADLAGGRDLSFDTMAFPDAVALGGQPVAVTYAYAPGEAGDGVTLRLALELAQGLSPASVAWAVPGLRGEQVAELLRALPKAIRRELMPFPPKIAEITHELRPVGPSLLHDLAKFISQRYGVTVTVGSWPADALPVHLQPRVEIVTPDQKLLGTGRDLDALRRQFEKTRVEPSADSPAWSRAARQWERFSLTGWTFSDLPERITVEEPGPLPLYAWPGLQVEDGNVCVRLFRSQDAARRASLPGVQRLVELALQKDLAWLAKDLRSLARFDALLGPPITSEDLQAAAVNNLKRHLLPSEPLPGLTVSHFNAALERARERLPGLATQLIDRVGTILQLRRDVLQRCPAPAASAPAGRMSLAEFKQVGATPKAGTGYTTMRADLDALVPGTFLEVIPFEQLAHLPRYLKAMLIRAERAGLNPLKEQERVRQLAPYLEALRRHEATQTMSIEGGRLVKEFRWMVEEFKVSLFAQELRTAYPISPKRLDQHLERIRQVA